MVDGSPDADRFMKVIGGMLDSTRRVGADIRAFGEMVALLWHQDNVTGAIALESLWNDLADRQQFSLLCAYPTTALDHGRTGRRARGVPPALRRTPAVELRLPSTLRRRGPGEPTRSDVFVALPEAVVAARRFVRGALTSWGEGHLVGDGELIVSELATNAVHPRRLPLPRLDRMVPARRTHRGRGRRAGVSAQPSGDVRRTERPRSRHRRGAVLSVGMRPGRRREGLWAELETQQA